MNKKKISWIVAVLVIAILFLWYLFSLPKTLFNSPLSALLESSDGTLMGARIAHDGQWRFPPIEKVPDKFAKCITAFEDKRFYYHFGVDPLAVGSALKTNILQGEIKRGGSTISMQTIRLSRGAEQRTISTKIKEAILATRLELRYSKDEILALYASNAPFGGNVVGLETAAWRYFGRSSHELSWAESAMLAILPNAPSLIHLNKNRDKLLKKRNRLLDMLCERGVLDSIECSLSKEEELPTAPYAMPDIAHHYLETLRLKEGDKGYRSAIDIGLQIQMEKILNRHGEIFQSNLVNNAAAIVLDVQSGEIIGYCGNITEAMDYSNRYVDVVRAPRSSGSTLKPLLYAAMLDEGEILPTMLVPDIPFYFKSFSPRNFNNTFDGAVSAKSVIQRSLNVPSVRMLQKYGVEKFYLLLNDVGFTSINRGSDVYGLSLVLGGAEVTLYDLANVYRTMSAKLNAFSSNSDSFLDFPISSGAIWSTFDALSEVNRPEEEGDWRSFSSSRKVAWKTGTSYGNRDAWSVGVTPEYVVAVWVGNCDGEGRPNLTGVGYAAPVMFDIFSRLPSTSWFEMPEMELERVIVCADSGHPIKEGCRPDTVYTPSSHSKPEVCPYHKIVHLSEDGRYVVDSDSYQVSKMRSESWFILPPAQEWYYMRTHSDYKRLPTDITKRVESLEITYPQDGMMVAAPVDLDAKSRGIVFSAAHSDPNITLFWHLDGTYLGSTSHSEHKIHVIPSQGSHTLTVIDDKGRQKSVRFISKE